MAGKKKPTPIEAFEDNFSDARELFLLASALTNTRKRRMRRELREKVGEALGLNKRDWDSLDCSESDDVFVVLKPGTTFTRETFQHQQAMLRQAVVAGCTALETYVADKTIAEVRKIIGRTNRQEPLPAPLASLRLRLDTWEKVERYQRRRRAITDHFIQDEVRRRSSTHPDRIKELLKMAGVEDPLAAIDDARGLNRGTTHDELETLNSRRNRITHTGDRNGRGRARIDKATVEEYLDQIEDIVRAIEEVTRKAVK